MSAPPDIPPPRHGGHETSWVGEWEATECWDVDIPYDGEGSGHPIWWREYLVHDGHEDCCHHTWPHIVDREEFDTPVGTEETPK